MIFILFVEFKFKYKTCYMLLVINRVNFVRNLNVILACKIQLISSFNLFKKMFNKISMINLIEFKIELFNTGN